MGCDWYKFTSYFFEYALILKIKKGVYDPNCLHDLATEIQDEIKEIQDKFNLDKMILIKSKMNEDGEHYLFDDSIFILYKNSISSCIDCPGPYNIEIEDCLSKISIEDSNQIYDSPKFLCLGHKNVLFLTNSTYYTKFEMDFYSLQNENEIIEIEKLDKKY